MQYMHTVILQPVATQLYLVAGYLASQQISHFKEIVMHSYTFQCIDLEGKQFFYLDPLGTSTSARRAYQQFCQLQLGMHQERAQKVLACIYRIYPCTQSHGNYASYQLGIFQNHFNTICTCMHAQLCSYSSCSGSRNFKTGFCTYN